MYNKYKEADENAIGVDGLIAFCGDLDIDPSDLRMLVFCFNLQARGTRRKRRACTSSAAASTELS